MAADVIRITASDFLADAFVGSLRWPPTPGVEHWDGYVLGAAEATSDSRNEPAAYVFLRRFTHTGSDDEVGG